VTPAITALGMVSALGHDVVTSCAAARAGLTAAKELTNLDFSLYGHFGKEMYDGPAAVHGHEVRGICDGFASVAKVILLGAKALGELQSRRRLTEHELARTGLLINVSDYFIEDTMEKEARDRLDEQNSRVPLPSATWQHHCHRLVPRLSQLTGMAFADRACRVHHGGHAGLGTCVAHALEMMQSGAVDRCIVGGIDSRIEPLFLLSAARAKVLKTNVNPVGTMPGEAAAFFLLEKPGSFQRHAHPALGYVGAHAEAHDLPYTAEVPRVTGACHTLRSVALADGQAFRKSFIVSDLNGTARRATEWGYVLVKLQEELQLADRPKWYTAASFGDVGAAAGAVGVATVVRAFERGYAPREAALLLLASERGDRSAMLVKKAG
jgi:3-oxoacyl-[acyl-carrier-protein] synthase I